MATQQVERDSAVPDSDVYRFEGRSSEAPRTDRVIHWRLLVAYLYAFLWFLLKVFLGVGYTHVASDALRQLVPALAQKLYRFPGLELLRGYEVGHRLDWSLCLGAFLVIASWSLWGRILGMWLQPDLVDDYGWNPGVHRRLVLGIGVVILGADACLFYIAMSQAGWRGSSFSVSALLTTAAYIAVLLFVQLVSLGLKKKISDLKGA